MKSIEWIGEKLIERQTKMSEMKTNPAVNSNETKTIYCWSGIWMSRLVGWMERHTKPPAVARQANNKFNQSFTICDWLMYLLAEELTPFHQMNVCFHFHSNKTFTLIPFNIITVNRLQSELSCYKIADVVKVPLGLFVIL